MFSNHQCAIGSTPDEKRTRKKLVNVLARLASDQAGERQAAAEAAHRLVTAAGLTWEAILLPCAPPPRKPRWRKPAGPSSRELAEIVRRYRRPYP